MAEIKPGTIAYIKITDEPIFVLDIKPLSGLHVMAGVLSGVEATVRRPNVDEHGSINHKIEKFFVDELETEEDAELRKTQKLEVLKAQFKAERAQSDPLSKLAGAN
jgi:hypothetical protein